MFVILLFIVLVVSFAANGKEMCEKMMMGMMVMGTPHYWCL